MQGTEICMILEEDLIDRTPAAQLAAVSWRGQPSLSQSERRFEMENRARIIGISFTVGITLGVVVGAVTGNVGLWIAMGTVLGIVIGVVITTVLASQTAEDNGDSLPDSLPSDTSEE